MSPLHPAIIPSALRSGTAFPYTGLVRKSVEIGTDARTLVAVTNAGNSGTVMMVMKVVGSTVNLAAHTIPTISKADDNGGPTSGRAMKAGVSIVNTTQLLSRGGRVFVLDGRSRVKIAKSPSTMTGPEVESLMDEIIAFPDTKSYDGSHFGETREMSCAVVDNVSYNDFTWWSGTETVNDFASHFAIWTGSPVYQRPMSTIWLVFDTPAAAQSYSMTARASYYTRWSVDTVTGQSQKDIPVAPVATVNKLHGIADKFAGFLHTAEAAGVGSLVTKFGPRIATGMRTLGGRAAAFAPEAEMLAPVVAL